MMLMNFYDNYEFEVHLHIIDLNAVLLISGGPKNGYKWHYSLDLYFIFLYYDVDSHEFMDPGLLKVYYFPESSDHTCWGHKLEFWA